MKIDRQTKYRMERLRATNPRYSDWPELRSFILRALPRAPNAPTPDQGALVHHAYDMMGHRPNIEWLSLLTEVSREMNDRAMIYQGRVSPWDKV